jgi:hypothetical protein
MPVTREQDTYMQLVKALREGDREGVRHALDDAPDWPNAREQYCNDHVLALAVIESPIAFVRELLNLGADPNYDDLTGFPSLINVLSGDRPEKYELLEMLIARGADVNQRGVNDFTPLHVAANQDDDRAIALLVANGADMTARTRIDEYETPLETAEHGHHAKAAAALRPALSQ